MITRASRRRFALTVAALTVLTGLAACSSSGSSGQAETTTTVAAAPIVKLGTTKFGPTLVDAKGLTLYVSDSDPEGQSACVASLCAVKFGALNSDTESVPVGPGLKASLFKTIPGVHGVKLVTVNGRTLYRSRADTKPGQVGGQQYLTVFHAASPTGESLGI